MFMTKYIEPHQVTKIGTNLQITAKWFAFGLDLQKRF